MTWVPRTSRESEVSWVSRETHALNLLPSLPFHSSILHSLSPLAFAVALTPKYCYSLSPLTSVLGVSMLPIPSGWPGENGAVRVWCWCWFKTRHFEKQEAILVLFNMVAKSGFVFPLYMLHPKQLSVWIFLWQIFWSFLGLRIFLSCPHMCLS